MINELRLERVVQKCALVGIVLTGLLVSASGQTASKPPFAPATQTTWESLGEIRAGHILVRFKETPRADVLRQLNIDFGAEVAGMIAGIRVMHLQLEPELGLGLLKNLRHRPDVEFAEFDSLVHTFGTAGSTATTTFTPNDPYYGTSYASSHNGTIDQWGPPAVSAPAAWAITQGARSTIIAIVDTGVDDTHPDLASKIVGEYSYTGSVHDGFGHGTHVAGIAAAATNNSTGIAGMCPNCGILSVKVLNDQGSGYISDIASGITYAASHGARVISMSLGGSGRSATLQSALDYAIANNALPVCAMGNNGASMNTPEPAYWHDCLSVIATDQNGAKASFSNYGIKADVAAPGVAILSTMPTYPVTLTTSYGYKMNYDALSGTSMATPIVAGIAGLVISQNPSLTPAQVAGIIEASAGDGVRWNSNLGFGVVNAFKTVSSGIHSDYVPPVVNLISPAEGSTVLGAVTVQAAPTDDTMVHHVDFVQNGTRFMQVLTGASTTTGTGKNAVNMPAWTGSWPSTTVFNSSITVPSFAVDVFGNTSTVQSLNFNVQNRLVSQSFTQQVCWPATSSCPNTLLPLTTGVSLPAAVHLSGSVNYSFQSNVYSSAAWIAVSTPGFASYCGSLATTIDCYPPITLVPDGGRTSYNYSGGQINGIPRNGKQSASEGATITWTLTYPQ